MILGPPGLFSPQAPRKRSDSRRDNVLIEKRCVMAVAVAWGEGESGPSGPL